MTTCAYLALGKYFEDNPRSVRSAYLHAGLAFATMLDNAVRCGGRESGAQADGGFGEEDRAAAKEAERKDGGAAVMASHRIFQRLLPLLLIEYAWGIAQERFELRRSVGARTKLRERTVQADSESFDEGERWRGGLSRLKDGLKPPTRIKSTSVVQDASLACFDALSRGEVERRSVTTTASVLRPRSLQARSRKQWDPGEDVQRDSLLEPPRDSPSRGEGAEGEEQRR